MKTRDMEIQTEFLQINVTIEHLPYGSDMPYRIVVGNNPVNKVDPTGEIAPAVIGAYAGLVAITAGFVNWWYWATHPEPPQPEPKVGALPVEVKPGPPPPPRPPTAPICSGR